MFGQDAKEHKAKPLIYYPMKNNKTEAGTKVSATNKRAFYNTELERSVVYAFLTNNNMFPAHGHEVTEDLFTDETCRMAWKAITDTAKGGEPIDYTDIFFKVSADGHDISAIMAAYDSTIIANPSKPIAILKELRDRRDLWKACATAMQIAEDYTEPLDEAFDLISECKGKREPDTQIMDFGKAIKTLQNEVAGRMEGQQSGMETGMRIFDTRGGLQGGDLVIIAAETSQGKSTLATTLAYNMSVRNIPVAYYSLEMSATQLTARMVAKPCNMNSRDILYKTFSQDDYAKFYDTTATLRDLPVYFDEKNKRDFLRLCTSIRASVRKRGIRVAFIDYLQIFANDRAENREQAIADMARQLKNLATELNICIVALSQLSRSRETSAPTISRLRGSGQIEEAADVVVLIYRPEAYGIPHFGNGLPAERKAQLIIAKGRNIGTGEDYVSFNAEQSRFEDEPEGYTQKVDAYPWDSET